MDFTTKQWLIGTIVAIIIVILVDGFRRMRNARRDSLYMSLDPKNSSSVVDDSDGYGSEFPNGGARTSQQTIDRDRIHKAKSQYNHGHAPIIKPVTKKFEILEPELPSTFKEDSINHDQWVDAEEGDEDYYASQWDEDDELVDELDHTEAKEPKETANKETVNKEKEIVFNEEKQAPMVSDVELSNSSLIDVEKDIDEIDDERSQDDAVQDVLDNPSAEITPEYMPEHEVNNQEERSESRYEPPTQVPLNLEASVPVLMDSLGDDEPDIDEAAVTASSTQKTKKDAEKDTKKTKSIQQKSIRSVGKHVKTAIEPTISDDDNLDTHSANKPRYESKYFAHKAPDLDKVPEQHLQEVLIVNVKARKGTEFEGSDILQQVLSNGLRYGAMNIFHRHVEDDGEGPVLFSMANMLKPGIFDLKKIDQLSTVGVTFFLTLPVYDNNNMRAFDKLIDTAKGMAQALGGELNDENRSIMTAQTIEHYRERIRDFARRQQLEKNK